MRFLRLTTIAVVVAAIASMTAAVGVRPFQMRRAYEFPMDHESCGFTLSSEHLYTGTDTGTIEKRGLAGHLLFVSNTYAATGGTFTFSNETNRMSGFSQMGTTGGDFFFFCSSDDNGVYRYNTADDTMVRMVGNGAAGLTVGTGTTARIDCGETAMTSARNDAKDKVYMFSGRDANSTFAIVSITAGSGTGVDAGVLAIVAGGAFTAGHTDGLAGAARFQATYAVTYYNNAGTEWLILGSGDTLGPIRTVKLSDGDVKTIAIPYDATAHVSGASTGGTAARIPAVLGLAAHPGQPWAYGVTSASRVFTLTWIPEVTQARVDFLAHPLSAKWSTAVYPDGTNVYFGNHVPGNGTLARFSLHAQTITKTVPPTPTQTRTRSLPSRTVPLPTPVPPTPQPTTSASGSTPAPTNAPGVNTPAAPGGTNSTIDAAASSSLIAVVISATAAVLLYVS